MSTIIMLPAPVPTSGRGSGSSGAGASGASSPGDFAAALEAVVEGSVRKPGTQQRGQQEGGDAQAAADGALVTVAQIVQAASGLLAEVGGTGLGAAVPAPVVEGAVDGETAEGETAEGEDGMAQVLDLTPRLAAALAAEEEAGTVPTQRAATQAEAVQAALAAAATQGSETGAEATGKHAAGKHAAATLAAVPAVAVPGGTQSQQAAQAAAAATGSLTPAATDGEAVVATVRAEAAGVAPTPTTTTSTGVAPTPVPTVATPTTETAAPSSTPAPPAPPAPDQARPLADQLGVRLAGLRSAGEGQHVLTMRVDPESIGPIRVVAHIGPEGVRIELLGATEQAREALRGALPDLRRDLVAAGFPADLGLGGDGKGGLKGDGTGADAQGKKAAAGAGDGTDLTETDDDGDDASAPTGLHRGLDLIV